MKHRYLLFSIALLILVSCGNEGKDKVKEEIVSKEEQRNELFQEVINLHDEVMPKMEDIINLQEIIRTRIDSLSEIDSTSEGINSLRTMNIKLEGADESMMNWMREFDVKMNSDELNQDEAIEYFENEKRRVEEVKIIVNTSIETVANSLKER